MPCDVTVILHDGRRLDGHCEIMRGQLESQIKSLRSSLEANLRIAESSMAELEKRLDESQQNQQDSKTRAAGYYEAKNTFIQAKKLLEG